MNGCGNREKRPERCRSGEKFSVGHDFCLPELRRRREIRGEAAHSNQMQHTTESFRVKTTQPKLLRVISSSPSSSCLSHKVCVNQCTSPRGSTNGDEMRSISHPRLRESLAQLREATLTDLSAWKVQSQPLCLVCLNIHPVSR